MPDEGNNLLDTYSLEVQDTPAPAPNGPGRLWSLWDLMRQFSAVHLAVVIKDIGDYISMCEERRFKGQVEADSELLTFVHAALGEAEALCQDNPPFEKAHSKIALIQIHYKHNTPDVSTIRADLRNTHDVIMRDLWDLRFLQVAPNHRKDLDNVDLLGPEVAKAFPSAHQDIRDAGNALAVGFPNSAVFHLMRIVELGLRAFAVHLGFRKFKSHRKSGRMKLTPVAYAEWETLLTQIQLKVDAKVAKLRPRNTKQTTQQFYYPLLEEIRAIRDAWRIHTMHSRSNYSEADAEAIYGHVKRLMAALAMRVSEV